LLRLTAESPLVGSGTCAKMSLGSVSGPHDDREALPRDGPEQLQFHSAVCIASPSRSLPGRLEPMTSADLFEEDFQKAFNASDFEDWGETDGDWEPRPSISHVRAPGEYLRPTESVDLTQFAGAPTWVAPVVGVWWHRDTRPPMLRGQRVTLELVPEPRNEADSRAVAVDFQSVRIGYMRARYANHWHDVIAAMNREGLCVTVPGVVQDADDWDGEGFPVGVQYELPDWDAHHDLERLLGLVDQAHAVLDALQASVRSQAVGRAYEWAYWDTATVQAVSAYSYLAPSLSFAPSQHTVPPAIGTAAIERYRAGVEWRALCRRVRSLTRRRIRDLERERRADVAAQKREERNRLGERIVGQRREGLTVSQIAQRVDRAIGTVEKMLSEAGEWTQVAMSVLVRNAWREPGPPSGCRRRG
jgi:hypothetical protein